MTRAGIVRSALIGLLTAGLAVPLALLVAASMADRWFWPALTPDRLTRDAWGSLLAGGRLGGAAATSVALAAATAVLATGLALPLGRALARLRGWRRGLGAAAAFLPIAVPPIALATGLQLSLLSMGLGGSFAGVLLAHTVPALGYASLYFLGLFALLDPRIEDEARSLGAPRVEVWRRVLIPMLRRPIAEALALAFLVSWAQVPLTLLIGGGAVRTLPVEVLAFVRAGQDRYAATGALLLLAPGIAALALGLSARRAEAAPL
ncbi:MAG TPA: ABC transporter permease subunit [Gemmatimonadales bacterium]|nr:ABC transporter permease subunit [Gemmatimonadales bacterium]